MTLEQLFTQALESNDSFTIGDMLNLQYNRQLEARKQDYAFYEFMQKEHNKVLSEIALLLGIEGEFQKDFGTNLIFDILKQRLV